MPTLQQERQQQRRQRRIERYQKVVELFEQGRSKQAISKELGIAYKTVRRWLRAGQFPERKPPSGRRQHVGAFGDYLRKRWDERFGSHPPFALYVIAASGDEFVPPVSALGPFSNSSRAVLPGNHLSVVKPDTPDDPAVKLVVEALAGELKPASPLETAFEAAAAGDFTRVIELLAPRQHELDSASLMQLAVAFDQVGRREEALKLH